MVLNATFYTSSSAIIIVSGILFAFVIFNDENWTHIERIELGYGIKCLIFPVIELEKAQV